MQINVEKGPQPKQVGISYDCGGELYPYCSLENQECFLQTPFHKSSPYAMFLNLRHTKLISRRSEPDKKLKIQHVSQNFHDFNH